MATLFDHMLVVARNLHALSPKGKIGKGKIIAATDKDGLSAPERAEAELIGKERTAKRVLDTLQMELQLIGSGTGFSADLAELEWKIRQLTRAIDDFTARRDQLVAQRDALLVAERK